MNSSVSKPVTNKFIKIFSDYWEKFKAQVPSYNNSHVNKQIESMMNCANPEFGYSQYMCLGCGEDSKVVAHSCKSRFCLRCGRVCGENFAISIASKLHKDVNYRHLVLTIPMQFRNFFYKNRFTPDLYNVFMKLGYEFLKEVLKKVVGVEIECGCLVVLHTVGRKCDFKPHLHVMLMSGGIKPAGNWIELRGFKFSILTRTWKRVLLEGLRAWDEEGMYEDIFLEVEEKYKGFYCKLDSNPAPKKQGNLIRYLSKYLCRPQISLKRILNYNATTGEVVYKYHSHDTGKPEVEKTDVITFIGRMVQQILPKDFKRIRYYGLQSPSNRSRLTAKVCRALGKLELMEEVERRAQAPAKASYGELVKIWWDENPFKCKCCGAAMQLVRIWKRGKGWVYSIFEKLFGKDIGPPGVLPAHMTDQGG